MTVENIARVRANTNEPSGGSYDDVTIQTLLDAYDENVNLTSAAIWREKAASMAGMVDITEGNSSRKWSNAYKQALEMAASFTEETEGGGSAIGSGARTI
jgi:hypothetical protein